MGEIQVETAWILVMLFPAIFIPLARMAYRRNSLWGWWPASWMAGSSIVYLLAFLIPNLGQNIPSLAPLLIWLFIAIQGHRQIKLRRDPDQRPVCPNCNGDGFEQVQVRGDGVCHLCKGEGRVDPGMKGNE